MPDLISISRAMQNPALSDLASTNPAYLASLVSAAGDLIRRHCHRRFTLESFTEYQSGGIFIHQPLRLREFPVVEITRIAACPTPALFVQNTDAITNQRATIETTPTSVRLTTVSSGVLTSTDLTFTTYATLGALAAQINTIGHGWSATCAANFANWASGDLKTLQGAASVISGGRQLEVYTELLQPYLAWPLSDDDPMNDGAGCAMGWRLDEQTGEVYGRFPRGQLNIRIDYLAGFAVVPEAVQEACAQLTQDLYQASLVNNTLKKATLGPSSIELKTTATTALSPKVELLLRPYIDHAKAIAR